MKHLRIACLAAAAAASCAVVTAVTSGLHVVARWAEGLASGEGQVVDGLQQGQWTYYAESGQKRAFGAYKDDVQDGPWTYVYPNGNKEYEGTFAGGRRVGLWRYWHPNGSPKAQGHFERGREFGEWRFWNRTGQLTQRGFFEDGLQTHRWTYWHADGTTQAEGWFLENQKVGVWHFWTVDGDASQRDFGLPDGVAVASESWEDGTLRREGFLCDGEKHGFWRIQHRNGQPRVQGSFEKGVCNGPWILFDESGDRLASGLVTGGRPDGEWTILREGAREVWSASGESPALPFFGEWSEAGLVATSDVRSVVPTWLAEAASELLPDSIVGMPGEIARLATAEQVAEVALEPDVPVNAQPWTQRELSEIKKFLDLFTREAADRSAVTSRYAKRGARQADEPRTGGSPDKAAQYVGKPLPLTTFHDQAGNAVDLSDPDFEGQRVVLVVLRGFGGKLCVYCAEQTGALCDAGAFERFAEMETRLLVVYPGGRNGMEAFKRGYAQLGTAAIPPYGLLYQQDAIVGKVMQLEGDKVVPATFILDEEGIVRFAYIGEHEADRPSVELLFKELEKLGPAQ